MSYLDQHLMPSETIIFRTKPHWIIFSKSALWWLLAILVFIYGPYLDVGQFRVGTFPPLYTLVGILSIAMAIVTAITTYIRFISSEFGITNKRVLAKIGFIERQSMEILLIRIESIEVNQTIPGRILGYGSITIIGTGGSKDPFFEIPDPMEFRELVQEQIEKQASSSSSNSL